MTTSKGVVEAALYSAGKALSVDEIAQITNFTVEEVRGHLRQLVREYAKRGSAIEIAQIGNKWTMQIREEYTEKARAFAPPKIPMDLLKTAALIAYYQPILQSDLFDMVGSRVYDHVKALVNLNLITSKPSGRSFQLTTTRHFVELFGLKSWKREEIKKLMAQKAGIPKVQAAASIPHETSPVSAENEEGATAITTS